MPVMKCSKDGKSGWKYGDSGHCYPGPGGKKLAIKQGLAVDGPDKFKEIEQKKAKGDVTEQEIEEAVADLIQNGVEEAYASGDPFLDSVHSSITKDQRDKVSTDDFGWPEERKYPIRNQHDLDSAAKLIGRAPKEKQAAIKARIKEIAKRKGLKLPESWS